MWLEWWLYLYLSLQRASRPTWLIEKLSSHENYIFESNFMLPRHIGVTLEASQILLPFFSGKEIFCSFRGSISLNWVLNIWNQWCIFEFQTHYKPRASHKQDEYVTAMGNINSMSSVGNNKNCRLDSPAKWKGSLLVTEWQVVVVRGGLGCVEASPNQTAAGRNSAANQGCTCFLAAEFPHHTWFPQGYRIGPPSSFGSWLDESSERRRKEATVT